MRVTFLQVEEFFFKEYTYKRIQMSFIPPLQINISGNKCGGCCRSSSVKEREAPLHYIVLSLQDGKLLAAPTVKADQSREAEIAQAIFAYIQLHLKNSYGVDWEEMPQLVLPKDLTKAPSVAQIKIIEAAAISFSEGVKKGKSSVGSLHTPVLKKSPHSQESD